MEIIDNVLSEEDYERLWTTMIGDDFAWFFAVTKVRHYVGDNLKNQLPNDHPHNCQLCHHFHAQDTIASKHWDLTKGIRNRLEASAYLRVKANMTMATHVPLETKMHIDFGDVTGYKTAIYYVNSNDGYTKFETGEIVESVGNRLVIFDGRIKHCGSTHTNQKYRIVINFNYFSNIIPNFEYPEIEPY
jgi:hypothetical protein|tara:strand:+ start:173 stop:736 length:564 start_codon:yes stop_codon:yes gene_type:complete